MFATQQMEHGSIGAVADREVLGSRHDRAAAVQCARVEGENAVGAIGQDKPVHSHGAAVEDQAVGTTGLADDEGGVAGRIGNDQAAAAHDDNGVVRAAGVGADHSAGAAHNVTAV